MEKPILFNTEMVNAILEGRKTVTRRIIKDVYGLDFIGVGIEPKQIENTAAFGHGNFEDIVNAKIVKHVKAPCLPEDILYVRETWCDRWLPDGFLQGKDRYGYKADGIPSYGYWGNENQCKDNVWIPSIHMPKKAARIFLKVTDVRVERLNDMEYKDFIFEGITFDRAIDFNEWKPTLNDPDSGGCPNYEEAFKYLWNSTVEKEQLKTCGWDANPYVWVIEFERR